MRISPPRPAAVTLLSLALLLVWTAGAHLHLCFDGLEPATVLHALADAGDHDDHHGAESEHFDSDVEFDASLTRVSKSDADTPAIAIGAAHVSAAVRSKTVLRPGSVRSSVRTARRFLRPLLRAPPA